MESIVTDYSDKNNLYTLELHNSVIIDSAIEDKVYIIKLSNLKLYKCLGNIGVSQDIIRKSADLILNDVTIHGEEPGFPVEIIDFSLVRDGEIFGNDLDYPLVINGNIQLVIYFKTHSKLTITANKMYIILSEPVIEDHNLQYN